MHSPPFAIWRRLQDQLEAIRDSVSLEYRGLHDAYFNRLCVYRQLEHELNDAALHGRETLEIGRSNGVIASFLKPSALLVTGDFPAVDVCSMPQFGDGSFGAVILDQVLEHVVSPRDALAEVHRVLRPGGVCVIVTPFMVRVHPVPRDFWRFTQDGLAVLLTGFKEVRTGQWGNRFTIETSMDYGWLNAWATRRRLRALLRDEPEWPIHVWAICIR
jgi:SAM-dependent methyltransferase